MGEGPSYILCTRLADMTEMHPAQIEKPCSECGHLVGIYPTGQRALSKFPNMKILCGACKAKSPFRHDDLGVSAGTMKEIAQEARDSKPVGRA